MYDQKAGTCYVNSKGTYLEAIFHAISAYVYLNPSGFQFDYVFDWTILKYQQSQITTPPTRALVSDLFFFFFLVFGVFF